MDDYNTEEHIAFYSTVIRKLIDGQDVESYTDYIPDPWNSIAQAIIACPQKNSDQRNKAFDAQIDGMRNESDVRDSVFNADIKANLDDLENKIDGIPGTIDSDTILTNDWPEPKWAIPDYLPIGLSILAGPPKVGKSWLALQIALAIAAGGKAFEKPVTKGSIFYLALEDPERRLKDRMNKQLWTLGLQADFLTVGKFFDSIGDLRNGGAEKLSAAIEKKGYRLVVIDTFSRSIQGDQNDVSEMTEWLSPLQELTHEKECALMILDHHRKTSGFGKDAVADILGSTAKAAMADTIWGLYREGGKSGAKLAIIGREVQEYNLELRFDAQLCSWHIEGQSGKIILTERRQEIIDAIKKLGRSQLAGIVNEICQPKSNTHNRLQDLVNVGLVERDKVGKKVFYELP